jgi:hypothetical protein
LDIGCFGAAAAAAATGGDATAVAAGAVAAAAAAGAADAAAAAISAAAAGLAVPKERRPVSFRGLAGSTRETPVEVSRVTAWMTLARS